jgi:hypothetical protein
MILLMSLLIKSNFPVSLDFIYFSGLLTTVVTKIILSYEGRLKSLWTGGNALPLCRGRQSTVFSNGLRNCSAIVKSIH